MSVIGDKICFLRKQKGLTQQELADKMGYKTKSAINKIEQGLRDVSQSKIVAFAKVLDTTPAYLLGWEDKAQENELISLIDKLNADEIKELSNYIDYILSKRK